MYMLASFFRIDALSLVMMGLVGFVSLCVASFSLRYLKGDRQQVSFYGNLLGMVAAVFALVSADHILVLWLAWGSSNFFLVQLMQHKKEWAAARYSAFLAVKNVGFGSVFFALGLLLLYGVTGETSIEAINNARTASPFLVLGSLFILIAAMTQSAIWPFHRWLTSSLNSPTPVSAIMHAGLVNGGGFLLARFAPMFSEQPSLLGVMVAMGSVTAVIGTLWKLMQSDIKRMLASSTMGQMGFMIVQCGLGLFPAAVAHLCWHGLFKAYLFLGSGSAAQEKRLDLDYPPSWKSFSLALLCGVAGAYTFTLASGKTIGSVDTTVVLIAVAFIATTQFALPMVRTGSLRTGALAFVATGIMGGAYGLSVFLIEWILAPLGISYPQPLHLLHVGVMFALAAGWLAVLFVRYPRQTIHTAWALKTYVYALNASQPHSKTITTHRNHYHF